MLFDTQISGRNRRIGSADFVQGLDGRGKYGLTHPDQ
jgi:hypothetical protein